MCRSKPDLCAGSQTMRPPGLPAPRTNAGLAPRTLPRYQEPKRSWTERGMADPRDDEIARHFQRSRDAFERAIADRGFLSAVAAIADVITSCYRDGGKLLIAGNGGSAGDAQHIAAEFLSRYLLDRRPLPAIALTTDTSVLTAIGNDYGFERVFERQVRGLGRRGDVFLAMSTSGRSSNVLAGLRAGGGVGFVTICFTWFR